MGIASVLAAASAFSSVMGGISANKEAQKQAAITEATANLRGEETARAAIRDAQITSTQAESTRRAQKLAYLKSGVDLAGSPLLVMEATRRAGLDNTEEVLRSGGATAGAQIVEGRTQASALRSSGRQAFMSGLTSAGTSLAKVM